MRETLLQRSGSRSLLSRVAITSLIPLALLPSLAFGALAQSDIVGSGGFVSVYAGLNQGEGLTPGADQSTGYNHNLGEQSFSGIDVANAGANFSQGTHTNAGSGTASLGVIQGGATASSMYDFTSFTSIAIVHAGWADTLTINAPGFSGQAAVVSFDIGVSAILSGAGFAGTGSVILLPYLDQVALTKDVPGFDPGNSDPLATSLQIVRWSERNFFIGGSDTEIVNDTVTFAADIVIGEAFDLGLFALITAGARNNSSFQNLTTTASADATNTVLWNGINSLTVGGNAIQDFEILSTSGVDWTQAAVVIPLPAPFALLMTGVAALGIGINRRRATVDPASVA